MWMRAGLRTLSLLAPGLAAAVCERLFLTPRRHARPEMEQRALLRARRFTLPGGLSAWEWGHRGPRILLAHGWEGRGSQLWKLALPLLDAGFRVVTFDAPGHGDSPGRRSSYFQFATAIEQAAFALGPLHAVIAHSMGGACTMYASRNGPLAKRLVLIAPPVDLGEFTRQFSGALGLPDGVRERIDARLGRRFGVPIAEVTATRLASRMRGPLFVVHDEGDREVSISCAESLVAQWPAAELLRTRGLGHRRILVDERVGEAIARFAAGRED